MKIQALPQWMIANPETVETGNEVADEVITVLLSTSMFVGGTLGFLLDNTIPGKQSVCFLKFDKQLGLFPLRRQPVVY